MSVSSMQVPTGLYLASLAVRSSRKLWRALAAIETAALNDKLDSVKVESPVYIAGVARSGSTILLEMLAQHHELTSHRYSDFPYIYTPYWRNWLKQRSRSGQQQPQERAHADRIRITEDSPEAMEEVLWMNFFPSCHDPNCDQRLDAKCANPDFETFYQDHIRKLLIVRGCRRYLTKGNYNLTRLAYIQSLYPDARFLIPVRHPVNHIASLMKQDALFTAGLKNNPRGRKYLAWAGHFEFGPDKRPIHIGDKSLVEDIVSSWQWGDNVRAWAQQWNSLYHFALEQQRKDSKLKAACLWVRYEDLCDSSLPTIDRILNFCNLNDSEFAGVKEFYQSNLTQPDYYNPKFSDRDLTLISELCGETAQRLGWEGLTLQSS